VVAGLHRMLKQSFIKIMFESITLQMCGMAYSAVTVKNLSVSAYCVRVLRRVKLTIRAPPEDNAQLNSRSASYCRRFYTLFFYVFCHDGVTNRDVMRSNELWPHTRRPSVLIIYTWFN